MNPVIDKNGNKKWLNKEGLLHRTNGPAIEYANGSNVWYLNGALHRTDGPAVIYADYTAWFLNGKFLPEDLFLKLTGPVKKLPLYLGLGFDKYISERLKNESNH